MSMDKENARIKSELADISYQFIFGKTCAEKVAEILEKAIDKSAKRVIYLNHNKGDKQNES